MAKYFDGKTGRILDEETDAGEISQLLPKTHRLALLSEAGLEAVKTSKEARVPGLRRPRGARNRTRAALGDKVADKESAGTIPADRGAPRTETETELVPPSSRRRGTTKKGASAKKVAKQASRREKKSADPAHQPDETKKKG